MIVKKTVCIFCASSTRISQVYHDAAVQLTRMLIENQFSIKYGGGSVGLMGTVAKTALEDKGHIIGVIPRFMVEMEWANHHVSQLIEVENMQERKKLMIDGVDAVIALAGGIGTLDELIEVITLKQLGQFTKPVIILDTNNYYHHLLLQIDKMIKEGFMRESTKELWQVVSQPVEVIESIKVLKETDLSIIQSAQY